MGRTGWALRTGHPSLLRDPWGDLPYFVLTSPAKMVMLSSGQTPTSILNSLSCNTILWGPPLSMPLLASAVACHIMSSKDTANGFPILLSYADMMKFWFVYCSTHSQHSPTTMLIAWIPPIGKATLWAAWMSKTKRELSVTECALNLALFCRCEQQNGTTHMAWSWWRIANVFRQIHEPRSFTRSLLEMSHNTKQKDNGIEFWLMPATILS